MANRLIMNNKKTVDVIPLILLTLLMVLSMTACDSGEESTPTDGEQVTAVETIENNPSTTDSVATAPTTESGYPVAQAESGYPGTAVTESGNDGYPAVAVPENTSPSPPNPERNIPAPAESAGAVGGVLYREIEDAGFTPVVPLGLYLGDVLTDSQGRQALISHGVDSPQAEIFQTGVFVFNNVAPGTYGLVIDIGVSQFPISGEDGQPILIEVVAGQALDLGQIIVRLPNS